MVSIISRRIYRKSKVSKQIRSEKEIKVMGGCSVIIVIAEIMSMMMVQQDGSSLLSTLGIILMILGDISFVAAVITMRDSWRAGIAEEDKTELVTSGIYRISRNPAFLGFYLVYIGMMLTFINIGLVIITVVTIIAFHMQILQEETFLKSRFGKEYEDYMKRVGRYFIFI